MSFNYEQSIWGRGEASLRWSSPASFRLKQALFALRQVPVDGKILEVGCGAGQFIRTLKKIQPTWQCYGADISQEAISLAKNAQDGVDYSLCGQIELFYENNSLDAVIVFDVLEHASDPDGLLKEIARVLKPGGVFYCFVPCEGDKLSIWYWLDKVGLKKDLTKRYAGHINYFSRRKVVALLKKNNFSVSRVRYSEHLLGQKLGVVSFWLMERRARRRGLVQMNNEQFFSELDNRGGGMWVVVKKIINGLVNFESYCFARLPSPNMHIVSVKK